MIRSDTEPLHGVILAGSQSWGGCQLDNLCSRPLLPLLGRPVIWYALDWFRRSGIHRISVCGNSHTRDMRDYLGDGSQFGLNIEYREDPVPRGTAGCIRDAVARSIASTIVAADATVLTDIDLQELLAKHHQMGAGMTVVTGKDPAIPGPNHLRPAGVYVISRPALDHVSPSSYQDIKEMWIPRLYKQRVKVVCHHIDLNSYVRVLNGKSYLNASAWAIRKTLGMAKPATGYRQVGSSLVHESARVAPSVRLVGACVIGPESRVRENATLVGPCVLGARSTVGPSSVISHSTLWTGARVGARVIVDRSILSMQSIVEPWAVIRDAVYGSPSGADLRNLYWWPCAPASVKKPAAVMKPGAWTASPTWPEPTNIVTPITA